MEIRKREAKDKETVYLDEKTKRMFNRLLDFYVGLPKSAILKLGIITLYKQTFGDEEP